MHSNNLETWKPILQAPGHTATTASLGMTTDRGPLFMLVAFKVRLSGHLLPKSPDHHLSNSPQHSLNTPSFITLTQHPPPIIPPRSLFNLTMNPFHLPRGPWFDSILDCLERPEAEESYAPREKWLASVTGRLERHDHRAQLQKGQLVTEHHDAQLLTGKHVMLAYDARLRQPGDIREPCEIAPPYPPCERPIGDLSPILAGDLRLETQHRGRMMLVRVINNPHRGTFITTVVEDEQGTALVLDAYHHPQSVPAKEIMQLNDVLLLKEPFMKTYFDDWRYTLRVDHPGDMVKLTSADERIPAKWRAKVPQMAPSKDLRAQGNKAVQEKKWAEAHRL